MIVAFLVEVFVYIVAFVLGIGFFFYFIGFIMFIIELLKGKSPQCRNPFFWK